MRSRNDPTRKNRPGAPAGRFTRSSPKLLSFGLIAILLLTCTAPAFAQHTPADVEFDQNLDAQVPLDASFIDQHGNPVTLEQVAGGKPLVIIFAYYDCMMLCHIVLPNVAKGLQQLPFTPGKDFQLVTISINPEDTPEKAAEEKADILTAVPVENGEEGWDFLVGETEQIDRVAEVVGFHYFHIPETGEYAHPTGLVVLTPGGRISSYLYGIEFLRTDLRLALVEAAANRIGSPVDQFFLFCFHYDPQTGRYTPFIENLLKLGGGVTVLAMGLLIFGLVRTEKKPSPSRAGAGKPDSHQINDNEANP